LTNNWKGWGAHFGRMGRMGINLKDPRASAALHVSISASAPSAQLREVLREVQVDTCMDDTHAATTAALGTAARIQNATSDLCIGQKRLLELNAQAVDSALGFGAPAPARGTPSTPTHGRGGAREAQSHLGTGESDSAT
jgi:hypothetical protein